MITIPPLTEELLASLGRELNGCDFTGWQQRAFLSTTASCDVQAAPGHGKTTLLVAKLALLSRWWTARTEGVCVISHTNAARRELETGLSGHPSASALLCYPHFTGTVTAFLDRFLALPYLRGVGWPVKFIDDETFSAIAQARANSYPALVKYAKSAGRNKHDNYVRNLELADDFTCEPGVPPERLVVRRLPGQPSSSTKTGSALEELKAELTNAGYYRFADMRTLATRALDACPKLIDRLRARFPLVLLDEAQDTDRAQLALLDRLFSEGMAYQRLGDPNQTLYDHGASGDTAAWNPSGQVVPLADTRRFGSAIAAFASRLTVRAPQKIESLTDQASRRLLILFDDTHILDVLPRYAEEIRTYWSDGGTEGRAIWAVASRHNPAGHRSGGWPKTLIDYCPGYRSATERRERADTLCVALRQASSLYDAGGEPADVARQIRRAVARFADWAGVRSSAGRSANARTVWSLLETKDPTLPLVVQRLIRDEILRGDAVWDAKAWRRYCVELMEAVGASSDPTTDRFLTFPDDLGNGRAPDTSCRDRTRFTHNGVSVQLGSVHSVKGKTVDAILAVETEVYRGPKREQRAMDLQRVLPHAFGLENRDFSASSAGLGAATNVFVAATRPRYVLALAMRRRVTDEKLISAAHEQGWTICELADA